MITDAEIFELEQLLKEKDIVEAQQDFWSFCLYMDCSFFESREKILKSIAKNMQRLIKPIPP